jgi:hypothetical protein
VAEGGRYFNENKSGNMQASARKYSHFQKKLFTNWRDSTAAYVPLQMRTQTCFCKAVNYTGNVLEKVFRYVRDDGFT